MQEHLLVDLADPSGKASNSPLIRGVSRLFGPAKSLLRAILNGGLEPMAAISRIEGLDPDKDISRIMGYGLRTDISEKLVGAREWLAVKFSLEKIGPAASALKLSDNSLEALEKYVATFSEDRQLRMMLMRGKPITEEGTARQKEAIKTSKNEGTYEEDLLINEVGQKIFDETYRLMNDPKKGLAKNKDEAIPYIQDYFYGQWTNESLEAAKPGPLSTTTEKMLKKKEIPTVADGYAYELELRNKNIITNARSERMAVGRLISVRELATILNQPHLKRVVTVDQVYLDALKAAEKAGKIDPKTFGSDTLEKYKDWQIIKNGPHDAILSLRGKAEPAFKGMLFEPGTHRVITNLMSTNLTSRGGLRTLRGIVRTLTGIKFLLPFFHLRTVVAQGIVDSGLGGFLIRPVQTVSKVVKAGSGMDYREMSKGRKEIYKVYINGGGHHKSSAEAEGREIVHRWILSFLKFTKGGQPFDPVWLKTSRMLGLPVSGTFKTAQKLQNFVFDKYIPNLKFIKFEQEYLKLEERQGRKPSGSQVIDIIKEGQNFYGEMNEALFGRSPTTVSFMRLFFMAPGFREGNFRTMHKALSVAWDKHGGPDGRAWRSALNIPQYILFTGLVATIGNMILNDDWVKWDDEDDPDRTTEDKLRDVFKVRHPSWVDNKGRPVMVDLMTTDRDYFEMLFKPAIQALSGEPGEAASSLIHGLGKTFTGMESILIKAGGDLGNFLQGQAIVDWKGDQIIRVTDTFLQKAITVLTHEMHHLEPIPFSVWRNSREKAMNHVLALAVAVSGTRVSLTESQRRQNKLWGLFYGAVEDRDDTRRLMKKERVTQGDIDTFNTALEEIAQARGISPEQRKGFLRLRLKSLSYYESLDRYRAWQDSRTEIAKLYEAGQRTKAVAAWRKYTAEPHDYTMRWHDIIARAKTLRRARRQKKKYPEGKPYQTAQHKRMERQHQARNR